MKWQWHVALADLWVDTIKRLHRCRWNYSFPSIHIDNNTTMPSKTKSLDKRFTLNVAERRFKKACDQIVLLNQRLGEVQKRYKMAKRTNNRSFRYNLRLKLAVIEGARNMYTTTMPTTKPTRLPNYAESCSTSLWKSFLLLTLIILQTLNSKSRTAVRRLTKRPFSEPNQMSWKTSFSQIVKQIKKIKSRKSPIERLNIP